jgi:hypothetical protein
MYINCRNKAIHDINRDNITTLLCTSSFFDSVVLFQFFALNFPLFEWPNYSCAI